MPRRLSILLLIIFLIAPPTLADFQNTSSYALYLKDNTASGFVRVYRTTGVGIGNWKYEIDFYNVTTWDDALKTYVERPNTNYGVMAIIRYDGTNYVVEVLIKNLNTGIYQAANTFNKVGNPFLWHELQIDYTGSTLYFYFDNSYLGSVTYQAGNQFLPSRIHIETMMTAQNSLIIVDDVAVKDGINQILFIDDFEDGNMFGWTEISSPPATDAYVAQLSQTYTVNLGFTILQGWDSLLYPVIPITILYSVIKGITRELFLHIPIDILYTVLEGIDTAVKQAISIVIQNTILMTIGTALATFLRIVINYLVTATAQIQQAVTHVVTLIYSIIEGIDTLRIPVNTILIQYGIGLALIPYIARYIPLDILYIIIQAPPFHLVLSPFEVLIQYIINMFIDPSIFTQPSTGPGGSASYAIDIVVTPGGGGGGGIEIPDVGGTIFAEEPMLVARLVAGALGLVVGFRYPLSWSLAFFILPAPYNNIALILIGLRLIWTFRRGLG